MNKVIVLGNITKDLELKKTSNGKSVLEFSVAVNNGEQTEFINIQAWDKNADTISAFFQKGNKILIEGRIHTSSYEGRNGKVYKTVVIADRFEFVQPKNSNCDETQIEAKNSNLYTQNSANDAQSGSGIQDVHTNLQYADIKSDDLPFY